MNKKTKIRQREHLAKAVAEAYVSVDEDFDFQELGSKLQKAIDLAFPSPLNGDQPLGYNYVCKITPTYCVYEFCGCSYRVEFILNETGEPVLGTRTPVEEMFVPIAEGRANISESISGNLSARMSSEKGYVWDIQILAEGYTKAAQVSLGEYSSALRNKKGHAYYTAEALQDAVTNRLFDLAPFIIRDPRAHISFNDGKERAGGLKVNDEARSMSGSIDGTRIAESLDDPGKVAIHAKLRLRQNEAGRDMRDFLMGRVAEGFNIPYECSWTGGVDFEIVNPSAPEPTFRVKKILEVMSVDPIIRGNAGGKVFHLAESLQPMKTKLNRTKLAIQFGQLVNKFPKKYGKIAEAKDEGADAGAEPDIETMVATAYLKDNPSVAELYDTPEDFLDQPKAGAALAKWLEGKLNAGGGEEETEEEEETEDPEGGEGTGEGTAGTVAEGLIRRGGKMSPLEKRLAALEAQNVKLEAQRKAQVAESYISDETKGLPENLISYVRNVAKMGQITDTAKLGELIRDTKKNMYVAEGFRPHGVLLTEDESKKQYGSVLNLIGRYQKSRPEVKKWIAESLGWDPFTKNYNDLFSLKEMLRSFDGIEVHKAGGFGIDKYGRMAEGYDPAISTQLAYDAMHLFLQAEWAQPDEIYGAWRKVTGTTQAQDFLNVNTENFGYFKASDIIERVDQSADYTELALTGAENAPYAIKDFAFLFSIFWRDFVNDSVGKFQRLPSEMAAVFERKLYNMVMDLIWNAPFTTWNATEDNGGSMQPVTANMVDTHWGNKPATAGAVGYDQVISDYTTLFSATQLGSDAVTGAVPRFLLTMLKDYKAGYLVTKAIDNTPDVAPLTSTGQSAIAAAGLTTLKSGSLPLEHIVVPYWDNHYNANGTGGYSRFALICDPARQEAIQVFNYVGIQQPILMQEAVGTGKSFTADAIRYKEKFPFNVGLVNPRGFLVDAVS